MYIDHTNIASGERTALPDPLPTFSPASALEGGEGGEQAATLPPSPPCAPSSAQHVVATRPRGDDIFTPAPESNPVLAALQAAGLYRHPTGGGDHLISCPWEAEHAQDDRRGAQYHAPDENAPLGSFWCPCQHRDQRSIGDLLERLNIERSDARMKPRVRVKQGELHRVVGYAASALVERGGFYRSNDLIVTLKHDPADGDVTIVPITEPSLSMHLAAACDWEKFDGRRGRWQRCDVPTNVVGSLARNRDLTDLPELRNVARQPYLRAGDFTLINTPGYDTATGVYASFDAADFVLPTATKENAVEALTLLKGLLTEFEFDGDEDRATTLSAMLTATIRDTLKVAPGFNITASSPGSGKSYLASVIAPFASPGEPRNISYPLTQEEATKVVLSLALEQPPVVCFDDMATDWLPHGAMNRMLTSGQISERLLGSNRVVTARAASLVLGTGNNIRPLRDMARRVASIYLLPQSEVAATRAFDAKPAEEVRRNRGRYVAAALTIITAWLAAGKPKADVPNIAGFEDWSDLCRQPLIWLGEPDPATSLIQQMTHDPDKEQLGELLRAWRDEFGQRGMMVRQVLQRANERQHDDLHAAILELPCVEAGRINQSRFGRYLGRNKNRIVGGLKLVEAANSERRAWAVQPVTPMPVQHVPEADPDFHANIASTWQRPQAAKSPTADL
ncbi:hypothetical protein [uncultured Sphingomonas sp.]|uniref:hypothetical protein n=1 Tax=uncultured Sphingomonas sp. TaxID=158754 RepID=UPI0025D3C6F9|nr:hypothetical protein [uncultured Sphingomonas sp.]